MAERPLTPAQQIFVEQYLANGGNSTAAYRIAYPAAAKSGNVSGPASRLKAHPIVAMALAGAARATVAAVEVVVARYEITAERLADEMARLAFTRISQVADVVRELGTDGKQRLSVNVKPFAEVDADALAAIVEVRRTAGGEVSVKLADKRAAIMDLMRIKGWIADKPVDVKQAVVLKIER